MTTVKAIAMAVSLSGAVAVKLRITEVNTTVIGPVGSEIKVGVPPKTAATKPNKSPVLVNDFLRLIVWLLGPVSQTLSIQYWLCAIWSFIRSM